MPICAKCSNDVKKVYDCDHTKYEDYCVECYTELHYYITENNKDEDVNCERNCNLCTR